MERSGAEGEGGAGGGGAATDRAAAHAAAALDRARLLEVFRQSPSFLAVLRGPDNVFELVNDAYQQVVGHGRALLGKPLLEALPETRGQGFDELLGRVRASGEPLVLRDLPVRLERTAGAPLEDRFVDITYLPLREPDGTHDAVIAHGTDVTEHVRARRAAEAMLDERERTLAATSAARRDLEAVNEQLEHNAAELEMQAEELEATAAELGERSAEAELARAALADRERELRTVIDAIPALAWTARADGHIEWYNARWYEYTGATPEQMEGWGWRAVHDPAALPAVLTRWTAAIVSGDPFEMTFPLRGADGTFRRFLTRVAPVRDAEGRVQRWVGTNTDVEVELAARAEVEAAEARLRDIFEQAPVAVAVMEGPAHVYTIASPMYAASPGLGRPLIGRSFREAFPELGELGYAEVLDGVYETGVPFTAAEREVWLVPKGGTVPEPRYYNVGYQPLRDAAGRVYAVASVTYDVTDQVRARREAEAARSEAERQRAAAEEANRAKSEFLSTMSHELRTPLNAIGGYAELMELGLRGPVTDAQREDLLRIRRANQHLLALISDILNFAKLEAGRVELHLADVELASVVGDLEPLLGPQLAAKGLAFTHDGCAPDTPGTPHAVRADAEKVRQVLLNLLTNAIKFTDGGGRVALACETDAAAGVVRVRVRDSGRGIPAEQVGRIFEPFVQVDRHLTNASQQGIGLGLAISRELARAMGGDLTVESVHGEGSTFTLTLRRA